MNEKLASDLRRFVEDETNGSSEDYTLEHTLKETELETTELVRDDEGRRWVRKLFLRDDPSIAVSYRSIQNAGSPDLPRIRDVQRTTAGTVAIREYLSGPTLREWVESYGPLTEDSAEHALAQVCRSVRALHACNPAIIHRDINPSNVIVTIEGPRLIDFGIARAYDAGASRDTHAWGTTGYAAPEQFGFDQSDARTDVFALGMLYWFMLTGTDPEANLGARLRQEDFGISERAGEVIQRCVALAPEARFQSVDELMTALEGRKPAMSSGAGQESPTSALKSSPARKLLSRAWLVLSTGFMAVLAIGIVGTLLEPWRLSVPEGWVHALVFCLGLLLMFAPAWLLTTNLFGVRERLPFLRRHTAARCALLIVACFIVGILVANAATQNLPQAYVQLMQQNGQSSI